MVISKQKGVVQNLRPFSILHKWPQTPTVTPIYFAIPTKKKTITNAAMKQISHLEKCAVK